jgi:SAM-dependent methyltransferase
MPVDPNVRAVAERVSEAIVALVGSELDRHVDGYRWMCEMVLEEELEFRRNGRYRYSSFAEVEQRVYADPSVMAGYMDGLLLSQVLWANHLSVLEFYVDAYLERVGNSGAHLEVGPGHGLLLWLASERVRGSLSGWDVSQTSLDRSRRALERLGSRTVDLRLQNLFEAGNDGARFDSVVISEVLEHLERPDVALAALRDRMNPGGLIFANAPVNSPAVDHIWLFRTPEELVNMVEAAGFAVESTRFAPATGLTEARARKMQFSISCAVIGRKIG